MPFPACLTGQTRSHLCTPEDAENLGVFIHHDVVAPFQNLKREAAKHGFDLQILSGFRSFEDQRSIWNRKATGQLSVLDSNANPLDIQRLSERELVLAILRWSALPGGSRHHWGTDLDVFDANAKPEDYQIELIPEEVEVNGMFAPMHDWLDQRMAEFGFFRPYDRDRGGVACERWHLSYAPISEVYQAELSVSILAQTIRDADIELKSALLAQLDDIFIGFVDNTNRMMI